MTTKILSIIINTPSNPRGWKMDVLATNFKRNVEEREGYFSISEVVDDNFKQYIFNSAIKLKCTKDSPDRSFTKWIAYWEDSPVAIEMTVITTVLETGYIKAIIVDKKVRTLDEINPYPARNSKVLVCWLMVNL